MTVDPGFTATLSAEDLAAHARQWFESGDLDRSEEAFARLSTIPNHVGDGLYGSGIVKLARGDRQAADHYFRRIEAADRNYANACYQVGSIAEAGGYADVARAWYQEALRLNPNHDGALSGLGAAPTDPITEASSTTVAGDRTTSEVEYGVYAALLDDGSPLSNQTIRTIVRLRMSVSPRFIAQTPRVYRCIGSAVAEILVLLFWPVSLGAGLAASLFLGVIVFQYLAVKTTRYTLDKGRLEIRTGIVRRHYTNLELWRVQEIEVKQTSLNRLTGDSELHFHVLQDREARKITIAGLVTGKKLQNTFYDLRNLVFLLRSNAAVKGIIY